MNQTQATSSKKRKVLSPIENTNKKVITSPDLSHTDFTEKRKMTEPQEDTQADATSLINSVRKLQLDSINKSDMNKSKKECNPHCKYRSSDANDYDGRYREAV